MTTSALETWDGNVLEKAVRKIGRSPDATKKLARKRLSQARSKNLGASDLELKTNAARVIVLGHALRSGASRVLASNDVETLIDVIEGLEHADAGEIAGLCEMMGGGRNLMRRAILSSGNNG